MKPAWANGSSRRILSILLFVFAASFPRPLAASPPQNNSKEQSLVLPGGIGHPGGRLVVALRAEPKTLNPLLAADAPSREVIGTMQADLVHINRATQLTEPALAKSWKISSDGLQYTLVLRRGLKFSDGYPLDVDDVLFTFRVYLDQGVHAPQRDLLLFDGKPITLRKVDSQTIVFQLPRPYAVAERLFDGLAILPRHLFERPYEEGKIAQLGTLGTPASQWSGLGPFRLKEYVAGQRLVLERNPYYWKTDEEGNRLPYLGELVFLFVPSADAQVLRFQSRETDVISRLGAENFSVLSREQKDDTMVDAGPGLEYNFLFFNLNDLGEKAPPEMIQKQKWFRDEKFRQAVSSAVDREAIVRLVYQGRGAPLWGLVTPGDRRWQDEKLPHPPRSVEGAHALLKEAGFSWTTASNGERALVDSGGKPVEFSIVTSSSSAERSKMAALIQDDLKQLGMRVQVVPLEFRSLLDRVIQTKQYDASIFGLVSFDADPNSDINVWLSSGGTHLWNPSQPHPATPWEAEIDRLFNEQMYARTFEQRKVLYDRAQEILWENQPMIFLASPDILTGAKKSVGNFRPAVLEPYVLWNVDQLYLKNDAVNATR
ncbi:MAG: ABC transporter substrate-binding protein [Acidobacteria bacterium Pan2503]|uniref:ABC transporter substrate-binding protein n=1 Tax=Candidatus Acidiferrum panamense TaxID=2741543 RepID=A0A7V8SX86_9BACT|nr:ABC transporter substrate-binding protein [Candidatus Acidoferrum panamensis]